VRTGLRVMRESEKDQPEAINNFFFRREMAREWSRFLGDGIDWEFGGQFEFGEDERNFAVMIGESNKRSFREVSKSHQGRMTNECRLVRQQKIMQNYPEILQKSITNLRVALKSFEFHNLKIGFSF
jgi:hypothetical protein